MTTLAQAINATLTSVFDIIYWPLQALDPIWAMVVISLVVGLLMVWIFGKISNQDAIKLIRDRIRGNLIGVRLFQNDVRVVLGLQATIMRDTLRFMTHALGPMLVLLVPLVLVMTQLNLRFSARPLRPGEHALVKVQVRDAAVLRGRVHLEPSDGLTVDTPAVRIPSGREVAWRIRAGEPGWHSLVVQIGDESIRKELVVGNGWAAVSELRTGRSLWDILLYPGEPPIPRSLSMETIEVTYPSLNLAIFGWNFHWLVLFLILSIAFGFAFKGVLGVEI